ncbi:hypothetical protein ACM26V_16860 [Salipaludibacillus sp. HK11]|uniref:phage major capsid protein n=1 Tax=Salipaludibacillus sp. HK11 TaxID=3394320 RepID=UPI0039FC7659
MQTKLSDLVSLQVFAESVREKMGDKIRLYSLSFVQGFGSEQAGTISVNKYKYVGDAGIVAEGEAVPMAQLSASTENLQIKKAAKSVNITDEAMRGNFSNPATEAEDQLSKSVSNGVEKEMFTALSTGATLVHASTGNQLTAVEALSAVAKFGEDQDEDMTILANANQLVNIETDKAFIDGKLNGMEVIYSNRVNVGEAFIVKQGALGLYLAKEVQVEESRDVTHKSTLISADAHFATHVRDESKVVKVTFA